MTAELTKLVTLILGISISGERLVTVIKSIFPTLAAPPVNDQPAGTGVEIGKKVLLMLISFICCTITALIINNGEWKDGNIAGQPFPLLLLSLLASGGSAFWTNILGYLSSLKDLHIQQAHALKLNLSGDDQHSAGSKATLLPQALRRKAAGLKTVRFTVAFSGGPGTLKIKMDGLPDIDFENNGYHEITLASGNYDFTVSGGAATGTGAGCTLTVTGDVITDSPFVYGRGPITPNIHPLLVKN